jgi:Holliday junction resolvasome RuvABC endonuclease subunit
MKSPAVYVLCVDPGSENAGVGAVTRDPAGRPLLLYSEVVPARPPLKREWTRKRNPIIDGGAKMRAEAVQRALDAIAMDAADLPDVLILGCVEGQQMKRGRAASNPNTVAILAQDAGAWMQAMGAEGVHVVELLKPDEWRDLLKVSKGKGRAKRSEWVVCSNFRIKVGTLTEHELAAAGVGLAALIRWERQERKRKR